MKPSKNFDDLVKLIATLRKECPWDRKQTHDSIKNNLIEEAYEAVDAIDDKNDSELSKELGDLLLHVIFHSKIADERQSFNIEDVIYQISEKLIRRHPHVFSDGDAKNESEVASNWESIKLKEGKESILDGIPRNMPGLIRAQRIQEKAANVGFDWSEWQLAWEKLSEEIDEWKESLHNQDKEQQIDEFGDILFSMVNVGRLLKLNAEDSINKANKKFEQRFRYIETRLAERGVKITDSSLEEMDMLWNEFKELNSNSID